MRCCGSGLCDQGGQPLQGGAHHGPSSDHHGGQDPTAWGALNCCCLQSGRPQIHHGHWQHDSQVQTFRKFCFLKIKKNLFPFYRGFLPNKAASKTGQIIKTGATLISTVTRKDAGVLTLACSPAKVGVATVVTTSVYNLLPSVRSGENSRQWN